MTPGARLAAAMEVIPAIDERYRPVAEALKDWGAAHRFAGSKDRAAIGNLVYDALRWRRSTAWVMGEETPRALVLGMVARRWGLGAAGVSALVAGDPHAPPPLSEAEAERIAGADLADAPEAARGDVPDWLAPSFERAFGGDWAEEAAALALRPPMDLRVNTLKAGRDKVLSALAKSGVEPARFAPEGIRVPATRGDGRHPNVQAEPAFVKGWFEVQDEGSQLAARLVGAEPGQQVLDLCAGAGGKTLALAALMANKGQLHATDSEKVRLAPIYERIKRAGTRNVQVLAPEAAGLAALHGRMDRVLIDSPCTGTGTWRRRPDAKWRLAERFLAERTGQQDALLAAAVDYLKPGGRLVYVTCSVLPAENADRVAAFLAAHPDFVPLPVDAMIAAAGLGEGAPAFRAAVREMPVGLQMTPLRTGTDGFYVAVLVRN